MGVRSTGQLSADEVSQVVAYLSADPRGNALVLADLLALPELCDVHVLRDGRSWIVGASRRDLPFNALTFSAGGEEEYRALIESFSGRFRPGDPVYSLIPEPQTRALARVVAVDSITREIQLFRELSPDGGDAPRWRRRPPTHAPIEEVDTHVRPPIAGDAAATGGTGPGASQISDLRSHDRSGTPGAAARGRASRSARSGVASNPPLPAQMESLAAQGFCFRMLGQADLGSVWELMKAEGMFAFAEGSFSKGLYWGAFEGRRLVCAVGTHSLAQHAAEIGNLVTLPAYRRRGLARACLSLLLRDLAEHTSSAFLSFFAEMEFLHRFYTSLGFGEPRRFDLVGWRYRGTAEESNPPNGRRAGSRRVEESERPRPNGLNHR